MQNDHPPHHQHHPHHHRPSDGHLLCSATLFGRQEVTTHKHQPQVCKIEDVFSVKDGADPDFLAQVGEYLSAFAAPAKDADGKPVCFHCGGKLDSFMNLIGAGVAWQWGMAHGEAFCSGCQWPARGHHFIKDADGKELLTLHNVFMAYMPEYVEARTAA